MSEKESWDRSRDSVLAGWETELLRSANVSRIPLSDTPIFSSIPMPTSVYYCFNVNGF
jgi:hypothetical protein